MNWIIWIRAEPRDLGGKMALYGWCPADIRHVYRIEMSGDIVARIVSEEGGRSPSALVVREGVEIKPNSPLPTIVDLLMPSR